MTASLKRLALWLGILIGICYASSLTGAFHFDDSHSVESNLAIRSVLNIPSFWTDPRTSSFIPENRVYRPLVYTFYSFCWAIGGGKTWPFHVMKVLMHWGVSLALLLIWARLWSQPGWFPARGLKLKLPFFRGIFTITPHWAAFFLAVLFGVHPAGSECVDYVSATTSLQCALFYAWAFYAYLLYRDSGERKTLGLSLVLYFLSVASKEEGITLPAMVFVTELFLYRGDSRRPEAGSRWLVAAAGSFRKALPFLVLGLMLALWILLMRPASGDESRGYQTSWGYFLTQWRAYLWYMRLWFWPWELNADSATIEFSKSITEPLVIQAAIGNLLVLAIAWFNRKRYPALLFGVLWFYITISPASSVVVLAEAVNEHRMYLAYLGFVGGTFTVLLAMAEGLFAPETRAARLGWIYAAITVGLVIGTQERNRVWSDGESLWLDTVEKNPTSGRALNNLALIYMARAQYDKALPLLEKCEKHWTTYAYCPLNKGMVLSALGEQAAKEGKAADASRFSQQSEQAYLRAYELNPRNIHVNFHLGKLYESKKDYAKASGYYKAAVDFTGGRHPVAEARLAHCYSRLGRLEDARAAFEHALSQEANPEGLLFEKGRSELESGDVAAGAEAYRQLVERNPRHLQAWYNYGVALVRLRDYAGARRAFERTVELDPKSEQGLFNLAFAAETLGDGVAAIAAARKLVEIHPGKEDFKARLEGLLRKFGEAGARR
ncbi:MAG: tetratricopeptide repeat protein [Oligoflexia bacterium]|nr:tetratricopeptide repeat protein [Oligoflexia bacterium]